MIPVIKNINSLSFSYGFDVIIDGSLSFDEGLIQGAISSNIKDPLLLYSWICPGVLEDVCRNNKNNTLTISEINYSALFFNNPKLSAINVDVTLQLNKNSRTNSLNFHFTIVKSNTTAFSSSQTIPTDQLNKSNNNLQSSNDPKVIDVITNYANSIVILPNSRGMKNEDLILSVKLLDVSLNYNAFKYLWTVNNIEIDSYYLNGRQESNLRIKNNNLPVGKSEITLIITHIESNIQFSKSYIYFKDQPPYGGSCNVSPTLGNSLQTDFIFSGDSWISSNLPLSYNFYFCNNNNINISLSSSPLMSPIYSSKILPVGSKYYLDVMDSNGLISTAVCNINVLKNTQNSYNLQSLISTISDSTIQLLAIETYRSNNFTEPISPVLSLDLATKLITDSSSSTNKTPQEISSNINIITSQIKILQKDNNLENSIADNSTSDKITYLLDYALNNIQTIVAQPENVANIVDIISNSLNINENNIKNNSESIIKADKYLEMIHDALYNNFIPGQSISFDNNNFVSQLSKISVFNTKSVNIMSTDDFDVQTTQDRRTRMLLSSISQDTSCSSNAVLCLNNSLINNISSKDSGSILGISTKINKNNHLAINYETFSNNSLKFDILDSLGNRRMLSDGLPSSSYEVKLKVPDLNAAINTNSSISLLGETACVKFDESNNIQKDKSYCETWYDYESNSVICVCKGPGLTVNIKNKLIADLYKLQQFPAFSVNLCNIFS